jgi:hypothetical protein
MHPPDGPLARLHSPEREFLSAFCHQSRFRILASLAAQPHTEGLQWQSQR